MSAIAPSGQALADSRELVRRIGVEIDAAGGWIGFDRYMQRALYEPGLGYYTGPNRVFGADGEHSNLEVVRMLCEILDVDGFDHVTDRPGHDLRYAIDASATRAELGWEPRHTDLRAGLAETVEWYRAHRDWWEPVKAAVEERYARTERVLGEAP